MKLLWVKSDFLHPTTRGGQIRTLEMLRRLHRRHEIHYVAFEDPEVREGPQRAGEYSSHWYSVPFRVPPRRSAAFGWQLAKGLVSSVPVSIARYKSTAMRREIEQLWTRHSFDWTICDFLTPAINIQELSDCLLFEHNVETQIWERLAEQADTPLARWYLRGQARRMRAFEATVCRAAKRVVAVSREDAGLLERMSGAEGVAAVPTGVDPEFFTPPETIAKTGDLLFLGSMDWMPNVDAVGFFAKRILPLIRRERPGCSLTIAGRSPAEPVRALAGTDPLITVTGTVPDVRPYLWQSRLMVVPLRVGGGTRLKIYEAMAAKLPVVSTNLGAEGLTVNSPDNIRLADEPERFAAVCLDLLADRRERERMAGEAWNLVKSRFSWDEVTRQFEGALAP